MNRYQLEQMADFQPRPRKKSRWRWAAIVAAALLLGLALVWAGQRQESGPAKIHKMRPAA